MKRAGQSDRHGSHRLTFLHYELAEPLTMARWSVSAEGLEQPDQAPLQNNYNAGSRKIVKRAAVSAVVCF